MAKTNNSRQLNPNNAIVQDAMKDIFLPTIRHESFQNAGALSEKFGASGMGTVVNDRANGLEQTIIRGRLGSVGAMKDNLTFTGKPGIGKQKDSFIVKSRAFQGNISLEEETMLRTASDDASFIQWFADDIAEITAAMKSNFGRQLYGTNKGVITALKAVAEYAPIDGAGVVKLPMASINKFQVGDIISFEGDAAVTANANWGLSSFEIIDIDYRAGVVMISNIAINLTKDVIGDAAMVTAGDATLDVADLIVDSEVYYNLSRGGELTGLEQLLSDAPYFGIGTGTRPGYLKPHVVAVKNFINETDIYKMQDDMELRNINCMPFVVTTPGIIRSYASNTSLRNDTIRRDASANAQGDKVSMGYGAVDLMGHTIQKDRFAATDRMYFLALDSFDMVMLQDLKWDDKTGQIWKQMTSSDGNPQLAWRADMYAWKDLFSNAPHKNAYIEFDEGPSTLISYWDSATEEFKYKAITQSLELGDELLYGTDGAPEVADATLAAGNAVTDQSVKRRASFDRTADETVNPDALTSNDEVIEVVDESTGEIVKPEGIPLP